MLCCIPIRVDSPRGTACAALSSPSAERGQKFNNNYPLSAEGEERVDEQSDVGVSRRGQVTALPR
jgi:dihydrodipicolinate reductase